MTDSFFLFRSLKVPLIIILLQVQAFRSFEFFLCYYGMGDYRLRQNTCKRNDAYNAFLFIVAAVPYWCRFLQVCCKTLSIGPQNHMGVGALI